MIEEKALYHSGYVNPNVSQSLAIQALARSIETAHEYGVLVMAVHLHLLLDEHQKISGPTTAVEMEELRAVATKLMVSV